MIEQLETDRLLLRAITTHDVDRLVALDSDPAVMRFISGGVPTPRADVEETVRASLGHRWTAFERATGEFVGWFGLRPSRDDARERALGYRLRRSAWGRGLATEGSRALIDAAFTRLGARRIWAETMAVNTASRRVMEHCGLRYVRTFHLEWDDPIAGAEHGEVEYELLATDWARARAGGSR